jgi:hypothetical protein
MAEKTHKSLWIIPPQNNPVVLSGLEVNVSGKLTEVEESSLSELGLGSKLKCAPVGTCPYVFIEGCKGISSVPCLVLTWCGEISGCHTLTTIPTKCPDLQAL